jgi:L-ascorbate metabolism protein UlaG (beta-lactamase superfamily)
MKLIGEEGIDLAILPIGDNFTMGPQDALRAVKLIEPEQVVPIHYDTFEIIRQDPHAWSDLVRKETGIPVTVLTPGGSLTL